MGLAKEKSHSLFGKVVSSVKSLDGPLPLEVESGDTASSGGESSRGENLRNHDERYTTTETSPSMSKDEEDGNLESESHADQDENSSPQTDETTSLQSQQQSADDLETERSIEPVLSTVPPTPDKDRDVTVRKSLVYSTQRESLHSEYGKSFTSLNEEKSTVSFAGVLVLYHEIRVGDHLDCDGPPLALGKFRDSQAYSHVDDYEKDRPYQPRLDPHMTAYQRFEILQTEGYSFKRIMTILQEMEEEEKARERNKLKLLMCVFGKRSGPSCI